MVSACSASMPPGIRSPRRFRRLKILWRPLGVACVAWPERGLADRSDPVWPFPEAHCPVHTFPERAQFDSWPPRVADLYARLRNAERALAALQREISGR